MTDHSHNEIEKCRFCKGTGVMIAIELGSVGLSYCLAECDGPLVADFDEWVEDRLPDEWAKKTRLALAQKGHPVWGVDVISGEWEEL